MRTYKRKGKLGISEGTGDPWWPHSMRQLWSQGKRGKKSKTKK